MALKRSTFTITLKNFADTFYQNTDKFQKRGGREFTPPPPLFPLLGTPLILNGVFPRK